MDTDIFTAFKATALNHPDVVFLHHWQETSSRSFRFGEALRDVEALASFLQSLQLPDDAKIGIVSENRYEWWIVYLTTVSRKRIAVPFDPQLPAPALKPLVKDSEVAVLFVSDNLDLDSNFGKDGNRKVFRFGSEWSSLLEEGRKHRVPPPPEIRPTDIATLVYTSGTSDQPKGVLLSHGNLLSNARVINLGYGKPGEVLATVLPVHHMYGFTISLACILAGASMVYYAKLEPASLMKSFEVLRPHYLIAVPALYERIGSGIQARLPKWLRGWLSHRAQGPLGTTPQRLGLMKKLLFRKVHRQFGGRLYFLASGGAPLDPRWVRWFHLLGIKFFEGYGLTETSPLVACNDDKAHRIGSVGKPIDGMEVKIHQPDQNGIGEVGVRGLGVMQGYYRRSPDDPKPIDAQGWFHTGDLGYLDYDGFLFILGRNQEVIVTANAKKVFPGELERLLANLPSVRELCVFGIPQNPNSRAQIVHLQVVPERDAADKALQDKIKQAIGEALKDLPEYRRPTSIGFSLTPFPRTTTLKIKKYAVKRDYLEHRRLEKNLNASARERGSLSTPEEMKVKTILENLFQPGAPVSPDNMLVLDLGMESLKAMELKAQLEKSFHRTLPEEDFFKFQSVQDILDYFRLGPAENPPPPTMKGGVLSPDPPRSFKLPRRIFLRALRMLLKVSPGLNIQGLGNLPSEGPYILAPNHESYFDYFFVAAQLPSKVERNLIVLVETEFFEKRDLARWFLRRFTASLLVDPQRPSPQVLQVARRWLQRGKILLIYPEGVRSPDGRLQPLKAGVSLLANEAQCPIVPVFIEGSFEFWPKGARLPRLRRPVSVKIGTPLPPLSPHEIPSRDLEAAQGLTERLKDRMTAMSHG